MRKKHILVFILYLTSATISTSGKIKSYGHRSVKATTQYLPNDKAYIADFLTDRIKERTCLVSKDKTPTVTSPTGNTLKEDKAAKWGSHALSQTRIHREKVTELAPTNYF